MKVQITLTNRTPLIPGTPLLLHHQSDNLYDNEAISVTRNDQHVGFVSASYKTRLPNTVSCGRIYDRITTPHAATAISANVAELELNPTSTI